MHLLVIHSRFYTVRSRSYLTGWYHTPFMYSRVCHCGPDIRFDQVATADSDCLVWCSHAGGPHSPFGEQLWPVIVDCEVGWSDGV